jgi:hypothetical protein
LVRGGAPVKVGLYSMFRLPGCAHHATVSEMVIWHFLEVIPVHPIKSICPDCRPLQFYPEQCNDINKKILRSPSPKEKVLESGSLDMIIV